MEALSLRNLNPGEKGIVTGIKCSGSLRRRILDMGIVNGVEIKLNKTAPMGDPLELSLRGYKLSLRKRDAENIQITRV